MNTRVFNNFFFGVLTVGLFYFLFCLYYAAKRQEVDDWNLRDSQFSNQMWVKDPALKVIHTRMVEGAHSMSGEVTIISAYFNIGSFNKGGPFNVYTPAKYVRWMSVFGRIDNPVIVFTDSPSVRRFLHDLRRRFPSNRTRIYLIKRESLWSFQLAPEIKNISQPSYSKHDPNTVHDNYSCMMHAKFELVNRVITQGLFHTKYLAWMDIGLFRGLTDRQKYTFPLTVPPEFDLRKVTFSGQNAFNPNLTPMQVVAGNKVWVGGAMFLGRPEILYIFTQDYLRAVRQLLDMGIMSTDQQVIYIMYLPSFDFQPRVELQTYTTHGDDDWFYLGYMIKDAWDISLRSAEPAARFLLSIMT